MINNPVTYTATVYGSSSVPSGTVPTGSVAFNDNGTLVSEPITASGSTWIAQYTTSYATAGTHSVTAVYQGDANFSESGGGPLSESVVASKTTSQISVSASANPAVVNTPVTFTLTVNAGATGTITLYSGNTVLASGSPNSTGKFVTPGISFAAIQSYTLTASYSGDANFTSSATTYTENVLAGSTITLTSSANPVLLGSSVTLSGTVTDTASNTPLQDGTVNLYDGSTLLTTTALTVSSTGGYTFTTSSLPAGVQSITARYSGDTTHTIAYASLSETVQANTSTTLVLVVQSVGLRAVRRLHGHGDCPRGRERGRIGDLHHRRHGFFADHAFQRQGVVLHQRPERGIAYGHGYVPGTSTPRTAAAPRSRKR